MWTSSMRFWLSPYFPNMFINIIKQTILGNTKSGAYYLYKIPDTLLANFYRTKFILLGNSTTCIIKASSRHQQGKEKRKCEGKKCRLLAEYLALASQIFKIQGKSSKIQVQYYHQHKLTFN